MRIVIMDLLLLTASLAAMVGHADSGDSSPFLLDTADGTRIATAGTTERITYSPRWGNAAECTITIDGNRLLSTAEEGATTWTPQGVGGHTLTHTAGDLTYTAQFTVLGDDVAVHGGALGASETWGTDKVHLVTSAVTVPSGISLTIASGAVVKFMPGTSLTIANDGSCTARGVVFTHVNDDTVGGDTLCDGEGAAATSGDYAITGSVADDDATEYRYMPPQTLTSSISYDTRLRGYRTYIVSNSVTVASGATLTLQPGTILKFNSGCSLTVNGTLDAQGTRAAPIVFTSLKDDEHGGDTNGDGDRTRAAGGDWRYIYVSGTANLRYCKAMYGAPSNETGIIETTGSGVLNMDCCYIAHALYDGIWNWGGSISVKNTVITDTGWATAPYRGSKNEYINCVIVGNNVGLCYWSNWNGSTSYRNCVFAECANGWCELGSNRHGDPSSRVNVANCLFWNPVGFSSQSCGIVGSNGNIWGDPKFVDPDNGDFRIAADSPCVDAGDGAVAPEEDYWGQPRMDVKVVADTGTPNGDGVCPDIGIYEVPGAAPVPLPDLAVLGVAVSASGGGSPAPGDVITLTYVVTNHGAAAVSGVVRDLVRFKGADEATGGLAVDAGAVEQTYRMAAGAGAEFAADVVVPTLKAGAWRIEVGVNIDNHPYEQNLSNNKATSDGSISVELESMGLGRYSATVGRGETAGFVLSGLPAEGGTVRITGSSQVAVAAYGANGVLPGAATSAVLPTVRLADGSLLVVFPARPEGENAYLVLENRGAVSAMLSVEVKEAELALYGVSPVRIANSGEATVTITGCGLSADVSASLGGRAAKAVEVLSAAQVAATFDVEGLAASAYGVTVVDRSRRSATLPNAVEIYAATTDPKLRAWLEMPSSVRDGRIFTGYVCYANEGDSPMPMPVFKVAREDSSTKMGLVASEALTETKLFVGGISPTHPAGVLKPGDKARIPFYFQPFGTYSIKLSHTKDEDNASDFPLFGGTKEYLAAMSAAATRLNLRGRTEYDIHDFVDQALWEKNGVACAAVSGHLVDAKTGEPLANTAVSLVAADSEAQLPPAAGKTDDSGYFQLTNLANGEYRWLLEDGNTLADTSTNTVTVAGQTDINGCTVYAMPGGTISGYVMGEDGVPVGGVTIAIMDAEGGVSMAMEADGFGAFSFCGLPDGEYSIRSMPLDGYVSASLEHLGIDAATRQIDTEICVGRGAVLGGSVTFNGVAATNGVVQAVMPDGTALETLCSSDGTYAFDGIAAGSYAVRYYSNEALSNESEVLLTNGEKRTLDLAAAERPLFMPTLPVGYGTCTTGFFLADAARADGVSSWAWDFDSDGNVDSTASDPTWTYTAVGVYTVTLSITEDGRVTTSVYHDCVEVREYVPTILEDGAIVGGINAGSLAVVSAADGALTLSGNPDSGVIAAGNVILIADGDDVYCRRVVSSAKSSDNWELQTVDAEPTDAYKQFAFSVSAPYEIDDTAAPQAKKLLSASGKGNARGMKAIPVNSEEDGFSLIKKAEVAVTGTITPHLTVYWINERRNGHQYQKRGFSGSLELGMYGGLEGTLGATYKVSVPVPVKINVPTSVPFLSVTGEGSLYASVTGQVKGKLGLSLKVQPTVTVAWECIDEGKWRRLPAWEQPKGDPPVKIEGDIEGTFEIRVGFKPKIGLKWTVVEVAAEADVFLADEFKASLRAPAEFNGRLGIDISGVTSLVAFGKKLPAWVTPTLEGPRFNLVHWEAATADFDWTPAKDIKIGDPVAFHNKSGKEKGKILFFSELEYPAKGYKWDFSNDQPVVETKDATTTFPEEAHYRVYLQALGSFFTGPYRVGKWVTVGKPEEEPEKGSDEQDDGRQDTPKQSCDPNEVNGPMGVGEARLVKPGEWMDYTIYFENKAGFDIADAQEVRVTNPLSQWLDWGTFEMRDIGFNNQIDIGLDGLSSGTSDARINGTDKYVRTSVSLDTAHGVAEWYMRVYDPNGMFGWPNDNSGFLPSNDETHRGEGHLTYRIKVRDDAPAGVVINNSATIVFDYNEPIETDPAWWNTVAEVAGVKISIDGVETTLNLIVGEPYGELPEPAGQSGWTFGGWYTGPDGTGRRVTAQSLVESGDSALYEYWLANAYTVRFNANGGTGVMSNQAFMFDVAAALDANGFSRAGYTFVGWAYDGNGAVVFADCEEVLNLASEDGAIVDLYAVWKANNPDNPDDPDDHDNSDDSEPPEEPVVVLVTFDANGGVGGWSREMEEGAEIDVPVVTRDGYRFVGWEPDAMNRVPSADVTFVAQWERGWIADDHGAPGLAAASVWDGWISEKARGKSEELRGVLQVKVGKAGKTGEAKVAATVTMLGAKKEKVAMSPVSAESAVSTGTARDGTALSLEFGATELRGSYGRYDVMGALNGFVSKDKAAQAAANAALAKWLGPVNVAWPGDDGWNTLAVTIAKKGKAKATGMLSDGAKLSGTAQVARGDDWCAVPVLVTKKEPMAFTLWLGSDGGTVDVEGLGDGAVAGRAGMLAEGSAFWMDVEAFVAQLRDATFRDMLPDGVAVLQNGAKWEVPKAGKVAFMKGTNEIDREKAGANPSGLKLAYAAKKGSFKGSFKAYTAANGKPKALSAKITGVMIKGIAYGTATVKKLKNFAVEVRRR